MNIIVFVKLVPDTNNVQWTANNNIDRANTDCIMNPADKSAIAAALDLKSKNGANITAISMGPKNAETVLREAIAMGVDNAVLLCDPKFAGSDTCATSKVLAAVIKEKYPNTDLILFGQSAIDGETAQTGPSVAVRLNLQFLTHIKEINLSDENTIIVKQETPQNISQYKAVLPVALCIENYVIKPELPRIAGYIKAQDYEIKEYNRFDLNLKEDETGVKGSPTWVTKVFRHDLTRNCKLINAEKTCEYSEIFLQEVQKAMVD